MNLRRGLLNIYLRLFIKRRFAALQGLADEVPPLRQLIDRKGRRLRGDRDGVITRPRQWGGVRGEVLNPIESHGSRFILYLHGGAFVFGSPRLYRPVTLRLADYSGARVHVPDYRLAPESRYPAALDDVTVVYRELQERHGARRIALVGDSAGGNLVLSLMHRLQASGVPLPACAACISPWTDLTASGGSIRQNAKKDPMLPASKVHEAAAMYANSTELRESTVSPLFGDFAGLPPLLVQVSDTEILLDDSRRIVQKMVTAKGIAELRVWKRQAHVFQIFADYLPDGDRALQEIAAFVRHHTGAPAG